MDGESASPSSFQRKLGKSNKSLAYIPKKDFLLNDGDRSLSHFIIETTLSVSGGLFLSN